jgi:cysteinyl-tRNA synthetase
MEISLYNTLTRRKEIFEPLAADNVTMYVCGPTVYSHPHIGNARPAVVFDTLARFLRTRYNVTYARNITDIDDKINDAARKAGVPIEQIAKRYAEVYHEDMAALGVLNPDIEPWATHHVGEIIAMIEKLVSSGHAYSAEQHVLFKVNSYDAYGALSGRDRRQMIAGARIDVAPYKADPADFVLWKPSSDDQPGWDSPWGRGRPGWHIECSAMAAAHLGETIDIHGGGTDLIFPHHENEIAQSSCAHDGQPFARFWLHNGFVNIDSAKMSKSLGNILLVHDLLGEAPGEAIRLALLSAHYRQPMDWTDEVLAGAVRKLDRLYGTLRDVADLGAAEGGPAPSEAFVAALADDLNTPKAIAAMFSLSKAVNSSTDPDERRRLASQLRADAGVLGLLQSDPDRWFTRDAGRDGLATEVELLLTQRNEARANRDFQTADEIRDRLASMGIVIEDGADGTRWRSVE